MGFKPVLVFLSLYKGVGVNEGNEIDVFVWCRSCRASWVIFWVNREVIIFFSGYLYR